MSFRWTGARRHENGVAAVEFALVAPLLITCIFGVVEGGARYTNQSRVSHYAAVIARDISIDSVNKSTPAAMNATLAALKTANRDTRSYTIDVSPKAPVCSGGQVNVTVEGSVVSPSGIFNTYKVRGVGVARCES